MKRFLIFVEDEQGIFHHKDKPGKKFRMVGNRHNQNPVEVVAEDIDSAYERVRDLPYVYGFLEVPEKDMFKKFYLEGPL